MPIWEWAVIWALISLPASVIVGSWIHGRMIQVAYGYDSLVQSSEPKPQPVSSTNGSSEPTKIEESKTTAKKGRPLPRWRIMEEKNGKFVSTGEVLRTRDPSPHCLMRQKERGSSHQAVRIG